MRRLVVLLIAALAAVTLPLIAGPAQSADALDCGNGVVVEGRCLSVDRQASLCSGEACVEFVEESVDICPSGTITVGSEPVVCELTEAAAQRDTACPDGARGEAGGCFVYVAIGPDGCPNLSVIDSAGNCRRPVADAQGSYYCEREGAVLFGLECTSTVDPNPSSCPAGTTRFDHACWQLNGLTSPETCDGHGVAGTTVLASGRCQVPLAIPTGPTTCVDGATYRQHPSLVLINQASDIQGQGPLVNACIDDSTSTGLVVAHCFYPDDDLAWIDVGDAGLCTRYVSPVTATCPAGYSIDDFRRGECRRFEAAVGGQCPAGSSQAGQSCVFAIDFAEFECPADTIRHAERPTCVAYRTWQGAATCGDESALLLQVDDPELGLYFGCFAHSGPQPDRCNGEGTLESCFEIREPTAVDCDAPSGCVGLGDFELLDASYVPLNPDRIMDTRDTATPWGPDESRAVAVTGIAGVPATGVEAVVLNVTTASPTAPFSWLTISPTGETANTTAAHTFGTDDYTTELSNDLVIAKVGTGGTIDIYNQAGNVHLIIDVVGYYTKDAGFDYVALVPDRILDTRTAVTPWGPDETRALPVTGVGGVPATGVEAVVLNVTTASPTAPFSWLTISPTGETANTTAAHTFGTDAYTTELSNDLVIAKVGTDGTIDIRNQAGNVHLIIDVVGYYATTGGAVYNPLNPERILDSRDGSTGAYNTAWSAGTSRSIATGLGACAEAVALHVTSVSPSAAFSWLTISPAGQSPNTTAGHTFGTAAFTSELTNDLVVAKTGASGAIDIRNEHGNVDLVIDIVGYYGTCP